MSTRPNFYMQRFGTGNDEKEPVRNLEAEFKGLFFKQVKGMSDKGKPKNIYIEKYAESDELRVHIPQAICREATDIILTLVFVGETRRETYQSFYEYVKSSKVHYWDDARNMKADMFLASEVKPSADIVKGSSKYIIVDFKFQNIAGEAKSV